MSDFICSFCGNSFEAESDSRDKIVCGNCGAEMTASETGLVLAPETQIAGYKIIRHLASGGAGSVYQAAQRGIALKILHPNLMDAENAECFLEETRTAAKFEHPHIVFVIDAGVAPTEYDYLPMQYAAGENFGGDSETAPLSVRGGGADHRDHCRRRVARHLDKYRMFHKDIKPENIMLPGEEPMILDLGAAQEHGASVLIDGKVESAQHYMNPEQAHGGELFWSTGLYPLGAARYRVATGMFPYYGPDIQKILAQYNRAHFPGPANRTVEAPVSPPAPALLPCMMSKTPVARCVSWEEFFRSARDILGHLWEMKGIKPPRGRRRQVMGVYSSSSASGAVARRETIRHPRRIREILHFRRPGKISTARAENHNLNPWKGER